MSQSTAVAFPEAETPSIPLTQLAPWALFFGLVSLLVIFFVSTDQGAVSIPAGTAIHEFVHDGRHLLAYPCH
jgi:hypothetical protein